MRYTEAEMQKIIDKMIEEDSIRLEKQAKVANYFASMKSFYNDQE